MIDFITSGTLMALPFLFGWTGRARNLALGAGLATLGTSLITNYEFGVVGLLPMKAHLSIDAAQASALMSAPKMVHEDDRWPARILAMIGAMESAVGAMTKTRSPQEIAAHPPLALESGRS